MKTQRPRNSSRPQSSRQKHFTGYNYSKVSPGKSFQSSRPNNDTAPRHERSISRFFGRVVLLAFLIMIIYMATTIRGTSVNIEEANFDSGVAEAYAQPDYGDWLEKRINANFLNNNLMFLNEAKLLEDFTREHPMVDGVATSFNYLSGKLNFVVRERQPMARYSSAGITFVIDRKGFALTQQNTEIFSKLPLIKDETQFRGALGQQVIDTNTAMYIHELQNLLSARSMVVEHYSIPQSVRELYIKFIDKNFVVKTHMDVSPTSVVETYEKTINHISQSGVSIGEYIDLRVEGKVIFK